jgi:pyruvate formate lyase activating enzyme
MNNALCCTVCPHNCLIPENGVGFCGVRTYSGGKIRSKTYGLISSLNLDPIEKKPLRNFYPGAMILSVGGYGCNLRCPFCQNHNIATVSAESNSTNSVSPGFVSARSVSTHSASTNSVSPGFVSNDSVLAGISLTPAQLTDMAVKYIPQGNIGIAYTYNEPLINYEYLLDCIKSVRAAGLKNILVTNGLINPKPLETLLPYIDAMNIDLKGFTEEFYNRLSGKTENNALETINEIFTANFSTNPTQSLLETVKETIRRAVRHCHVEITTLVIPGENETHVEPIARWLAGISPDIPYHISRFFPRFNYADKQPTPPDTIRRLTITARKYLNYVYAGNL